MAYHQQCKDGLRVVLPVPGTAGNSTRMELAAAIIAMLSDEAVHFGTDTQAFIDKATWVVGLVKIGGAPRKPWGVQKDGDLWSIFYDVLSAKGWESVLFTKVQGHATDEQVASGDVILCHKVGNDNADHTADLAVELHGAEVIKFSKFLCARFRKYVSLLFDIHKHILEGYLIHQRLTEIHQIKMTF